MRFFLNFPEITTEVSPRIFFRIVMVFLLEILPDKLFSAIPPGVPRFSPRCSNNFSQNFYRSYPWVSTKVLQWIFSEVFHRMSASVHTEIRSRGFPSIGLTVPRGIYPEVPPAISSMESKVSTVLVCTIYQQFFRDYIQRSFWDPIYRNYC